MTTDRHVKVDASAGPVSVTLPDPVAHRGATVTVEKVDDSPNAVTVRGVTHRYVIDTAGASDSIPDYEDPDDIPDEEDEDFDEAEDELAGSEIIRAKWSMDGADTLAVAAVKLRAFAAHLDA